ncbi:MAG: hypothetical protein QXQ08_05220 [Candidatus Bathyarchaeia archaeon]
MTLESVLATMILIIVLLMFLFIFGIVAFTFLQWIKTPTYQPPAIKVEDYSCPKCGSKDLERIGRRTLRCRRCGTTFTIQPETSETHFIVWPFFWWIPIIWPVPFKKRVFSFPG